MLNILLSVFLLILLSFYGLNVKQSYPKYVYNLYNEPLYKFIILICVGLITKNDLLVGLVLAMVYVGIGMNINTISEKFSNWLPLRNCNSYDFEQDKNKRSLFYPINPRDRKLKPYDPY